MKKIVCFSGGHSSALAAIETARKYGTEGMILLNHDISPHVEHEDIKRFKREVAEYIGLPVTYCQRQFEIVRKRRRNFVVFRRGGNKNQVLRKRVLPEDRRRRDQTGGQAFWRINLWPIITSAPVAGRTLTPESAATAGMSPLIPTH